MRGTAEFLADLELFKTGLRQDGEKDTGVEEVLAWFRECWSDDRREWVRWYVGEEAKFQRELMAMAVRHKRFKTADGAKAHEDSIEMANTL